MTNDNWQAAPNDAVFYGEVIGSMPGQDVDYVYGYSADPNANVRNLVPDGWTVDEMKISEIGSGETEVWTRQDGWTTVHNSNDAE